jgi:hemerythrin superfamily protein
MHPTEREALIVRFSPISNERRRNKEGTRKMNAIDMLKQDHRKVQQLFRTFETAGASAFQRKQQIAEKTFEELERHTKLEEEIFYPAVSVADRGGNGMVNEAMEEHDIVKQLIAELQAMAPDSDEYDAKFTVLTENVRHHVKEEEGEIMPHAAARLGEARLKELGGQMAERKRALMEPSFFGGTIRQAKKIITKALDAIANGTTPAPTQKRRRGKKSAPTRSERGKKTTAARKVRRAMATTKRVVKSTARKAMRRRAARRTSGRSKAVQRVGR